MGERTRLTTATRRSTRSSGSTRYGGALNLNLHFHALVLDGVYTSQGLLAAPRFQPAPELRDEDVAHVTALLHRRIVRYLQRRGRLPREQHAEHDEPVPDEPLLALISAASVEGRVALGPTSGQPLTRRGRKRDRRPHFLPGELCCDLEGFSLHAKVAIEGHDRAGLERLCRTIARPAIASERLSIDPDGRVVYRLRRPWSDGTSAIVFEPLAFLERLAALVPRPRAHLLTYHGVLAPAAQWRDRIVPGPRAPTESHHGTPERNAVCSRPVSASTDSPAALSSPARTGRLRWAELLRRVFAVDFLTCPDCGGARKLIAMITEGLVVRRILGPPQAAQLNAPDRSRQSASRARVRLVGRDGSELRASKGARSGGAVPRAALPARPTTSRRLPRLRRAAART